MPVTLVVAHHSDADRSALVDLLWRVRDLSVVGQAATLDGVLELLQMRRPDVLVIDLTLIPADKILRSASAASPADPLKSLLGLAAADSAAGQSRTAVVAIAARADDAAKRLAQRLGVAALVDRKQVRELLAETILRVTSSMRKGAAP